jgi:hypothetical protein
MVVRKVLNSLLPEGGRYGGQEGFKLIVSNLPDHHNGNLLVTMSLKPS